MDKNWLKECVELTTHRLHDVACLQVCWQELAAQQNWKETLLLEQGEWSVSAFEVGEVSENSVYLSAGMHGDEPVPPWALWKSCCHFAEDLQQQGAVIVPLWNPWGLAENTRLDAEGRDRNRWFRDTTLEPVRRWQELCSKWSFQAALALHEDYDACGWYLYEITPHAPRYIQLIRESLEGVGNCDPRQEIDDSTAKEGLIWVEEPLYEMEQWPEVFALREQTKQSLLTFETASEADLGLRALQQCKAIGAVLNAKVSV